MLRSLGVLGLVVAAACGRDQIEVAKTTGDDYGQASLVAAVDTFVKANRTPEAYAELAATVTSLRPHMDRQVGKEAELRMMVLAIGPLQQLQSKSLRQRIDGLALTVWPTLLAPAIKADAPLIVHDPRAPELLPKPGEDPDGYIVRLCGEPLARHCKRVVPEMQGEVIEQLAIRRATPTRVA